MFERFKSVLDYIVLGTTYRGLIIIYLLLVLAIAFKIFGFLAVVISSVALVFTFGFVRALITN